MVVLYRVKDNNNIIGYVVNKNNSILFIKINDISNYSAENAILQSDGTWKAKAGYRIKTIDTREYEGIEIQARHTHLIGKPNLIQLTSLAKLSGTQVRVLEALNNNNVCYFNRNKDNINIDMKDLSALTSYTNLEFSLFRRNDKFVVIKGNKYGMYIPETLSAMLLNTKYKWVGHTHPGTDFICMMPSESDYETLKKFNQNRSVIYIILLVIITYSDWRIHYEIIRKLKENITW